MKDCGTRRGRRTDYPTDEVETTSEWTDNTPASVAEEAKYGRVIGVEDPEDEAGDETAPDHDEAEGPDVDPPSRKSGAARLVGDVAMLETCNVFVREI